MHTKLQTYGNKWTLLYIKLVIEKKETISSDFNSFFNSFTEVKFTYNKIHSV